jgi:hypothetical protein
MNKLQQTPKNVRRHRCTALGLVALVLLGIGGQWWIRRPKRCAEHFVTVVSKQQIADATEMLADSAAFRFDLSGNLTIKGTDGSSAVLTAEELPLIVLGARGVKSRSGVSDYFVGALSVRPGTIRSCHRRRRPCHNRSLLYGPRWPSHH